MSKSKKKINAEQKALQKILDDAGANTELTLEEECGPETVVSKQVWETRRQALKKEIEKTLPSFAEMCKGAHRAGAPQVFIHQNAFGAFYSDSEYTLLGKAMKYAGFFGLDIVFGGHPTYVPDDEDGPETNDKDLRPEPIKSKEKNEQQQ
jgi:hypothetical protein